MKTIKTLIVCFAMAIGSTSFARGGSGGGGVLAAATHFDDKKTAGYLSSNPMINLKDEGQRVKAEYVRFLKQDHSEVVFEYAQKKENNELITEVFKQRPEEFSVFQAKYFEALKESKQNLKWVEIR